MRGVRVLQRHRVPVTVRVTVHRHNVAELEDIARFLLEERGIAGISTNAAGFLGSCRSNAAEVQLTPELRSRAMAVLLELAGRYPGRISAQAGPLAEGWMWATMDRARLDGAAPFPGGGRLSGCGCASSKIAVRPDGTYVPCTMLSAIELGRIDRDSLAGVWRDSPALRRLRLRQGIALAAFEECRGCGYQPYCTGNCPGLAFSLTGAVDRPSPDACLKKFLSEGGTLPNPRGAQRGPADAGTR
jgi:SynChlorMet cassette radical SAM/SPASM protein ScmE